MCSEHLGHELPMVSGLLTLNPPVSLRNALNLVSERNHGLAEEASCCSPLRTIPWPLSQTLGSLGKAGPSGGRCMPGEGVGMKLRDLAASLYSPFSQLAQPCLDSPATPPLSAILSSPWVPRAPPAVQPNSLLQPSHFPTVDPVRGARKAP